MEVPPPQKSGDDMRCKRRDKNCTILPNTCYRRINGELICLAGDEPVEADLDRPWTVLTSKILRWCMDDKRLWLDGKPCPEFIAYCMGRPVEEIERRMSDGV